MRIKSFLVLLLAAAIIVLGATLPALVSNRQDAANDNQVLFAPVNDVQLEFIQDDITLSQTVAMVGAAWDIIEIPYSLTSLGQDKAEAAAIAAVERYQQAGVFSRNLLNGGEIRYCQPILVYGNTTYDSSGQRDSGSNSNRQNNIFWDISYGASDDEFTFYTIIDDRTGAVCSINYSNVSHKYRTDEMEFVLAGLCDLYLTDLGEEFYWCNPEAIVEKAESPLDGSYLASHISWDDAVYGECQILFFVNEYGFYTNISNIR